MMTDLPGRSTQVGEKRLDPMRLTVEEAAELLGVEESLIEDDLSAGLPRNPDGTISLVVYGAWLNMQIGEGQRHAES